MKVNNLEFSIKFSNLYFKVFLFVKYSAAVQLENQAIFLKPLVFV